MKNKCTRNVGLFKALADRHRVRIVDVLSGGEQCACDLLAEFDITQPTLSHHMKILCDCRLVNARKEGKMMLYSLNNQTVENLKECLCCITGNPEDCTCEPRTCTCGCCENCR